LADVTVLARLLQKLGVAVQSIGADAIRLENVDDDPIRADARLVRRMRASFCVLGPLLARRGKAIVAMPGGCNIGPRTVELHLAGLAALGADVRVHRGAVVAEARRLTGATIHLAGPAGPTVTGTANVMSAATLARGTTVLHGAAREPEVVDLGQFLIAMGARIDGLGTSTLTIDGVDRLRGADYRVIPDRIEAATLLLSAAFAGGRVAVNDCRPEQMTAMLDHLDRCGCRTTVESNRIEVAGPARRPVRVVARPYPGTPTDMQAQLTALAALAPGCSVVRDRVFPERFAHAAELNRMGASIRVRRGVAMIEGVDSLSGAVVDASDLRGSAALVLAALAARGETIVRRIHHLDRGYFRLEEKLASLGARIERIRVGRLQAVG
jgi:UDP-N-acetylglucosamine 1-carboxyvinyltransferase